jgi:hypothetical protein
MELLDQMTIIDRVRVKMARDFEVVCTLDQLVTHAGTVQAVVDLMGGRVVCCRPSIHREVEPPREYTRAKVEKKQVEKQLDLL